jgi:hypothetical protein
MLERKSNKCVHGLPLDANLNDTSASGGGAVDEQAAFGHDFLAKLQPVNHLHELPVG